MRLLDAICPTRDAKLNLRKPNQVAANDSTWLDQAARFGVLPSSRCSRLHRQTAALGNHTEPHDAGEVSPYVGEGVRRSCEIALSNMMSQILKLWRICFNPPRGGHAVYEEATPRWSRGNRVFDRLNDLLVNIRFARSDWATGLALQIQNKVYL